MRLEEYLESLRTADGESLASELGVCYGFNILLQGDFDSIVYHLFQVGDGNSKGESLILPRFTELISGGVHVFVKDFLTADQLTSPDEDYEVGYEHPERQQRDYNIAARIEERWRERTRPLPSLEMLAAEILRLGEKLIEVRIPACFSHSIGSKNPYDFEKVVYHEP
jgi:hypothetical protein